MNFRQFRYVQEAVRYKLNLTETARALGTSQPGLSKGILDFEHELDVEIFARHGKRLVRLTEAGERGRTRIDQVFAQHRLTPCIVLEAIDSDVIKTYVRLGLGVGLVAEMAVRGDGDQDLVARLDHWAPCSGAERRAWRSVAEHSCADMSTASPR